MNNEFKKVKNNSETRYVLETATAGATSAGSVASVTGTVGKVQKRGNILAQEANKKKEAPKPRNFVAKNAKMGGAGQHKDKKKEQKQGAAKHKKPFMEEMQARLDQLKSKLNEAQAEKKTGMVQDRKTGKWYDPKKEFEKKMNSPEVMAQMKRMATKEGKEDKIAQLKKDHETAVHWSKNETSPQKREAARQKAEKIKRHLDTQYKQGVAEGYYDLPNQGNVPGMEPIDFSSKPSFKELITRYTQLVYQGHASETSPEEDQEYDAIEKYVAQRFGEKGSAHLQKAGEVSYWGRNDKPYGRDSRSSNLGRPNQPSGDFRTTKAGKMHGQDAKMMKAKVADRLGRHPEPNLPEGFNGEYDDEAGMAHSNLLTTARAVMGLLKTIKDRDNLPEWGQEKIAKAEMMLVSVWDYLQSQKELGNDPQVDMEEGAGRPFRGVGGAFNRGDDERHDLDPTDWYFVKDGKMFAISVYPNQEREATARGYSRTRDEAKAKASEQGVAEGASDFVGDSIEALRSSVPGLKQQDFLDELYMYIENQYGQRAAEMMSNAGQDDFDEWYDSYLDNPEQGMAEVDTYMESLAESLQQVLSEKAVSKKQQKFMGMVHAAQKGEKPASKEVAKVAKDMGKKDAKDFASTKHKGLPEKKKSKK